MVSLPETFDIDRTSSSSEASLGQQCFWNDRRGLPETHFSGFMLPPNEGSIPFLRSVNHEQRNVSGWSVGEAGSSSGAHRASSSDCKVESGWPSTGGTHSPRIEDQQLRPSNGALSLDSTNLMYVQGSGSSSIRPIINSNGQYVGPSRVNPSLREHPNLHKSSGSHNNMRFPIPPGTQVDSFIPSGSGGYIMEGSEVSLGGTLDGRLIPCKRKSSEGNIGQSSSVEKPNFPQHMESSSWQATPACFIVNGGPNTQTHQEQVDQTLSLNLAGGAVAQRLLDTQSTNISQRNFRLRVNSSGQRGMWPTSLSSSPVATAGSPSITSAPQSSSRLLVENHSLELLSPLTISGSSPQELHQLFPVPVMAPGGHSVRWSRDVTPTNNSSSSSPVLPDEASSIGVSRNMLRQHPVLAPSSSSSARHFMRARSTSFPGNADSAHFSNSCSAAPQLPHHHTATQPNQQNPRFPQRLSEYVHQQLLSSVGSDLGGAQRSRTSNGASHSVLLQPSGPGSSGHRQSSSRSALWTGRQVDSVIGIPYQVRSLAATSGDQRRFASEVCIPACYPISHLLLDCLKVTNTSSHILSCDVNSL